MIMDNLTNLLNVFSHNTWTEGRVDTQQASHIHHFYLFWGCYLNVVSSMSFSFFSHPHYWIIHYRVASITPVWDPRRYDFLKWDVARVKFSFEEVYHELRTKFIEFYIPF